MLSNGLDNEQEPGSAVALTCSDRAEASNATANRYLSLIRAILRKACLEWEWIERVPKVKMYPEPKRRVRWITPEQARALLEALPQHQREMTLFALATGLRQSNVGRRLISSGARPGLQLTRQKVVRTSTFRYVTWHWRYWSASVESIQSASSRMKANR